MTICYKWTLCRYVSSSVIVGTRLWAGRQGSDPRQAQRLFATSSRPAVLQWKCMRKWSYNSTHSSLLHRLEVSGHLLAPVALSWRKESPLSMEIRMSGSHSRSWLRGKKPRINSLSSGPQSSPYNDWATYVPANRPFVTTGHLQRDKMSENAERKKLLRRKKGRGSPGCRTVTAVRCHRLAAESSTAGGCCRWHEMMDVSPQTEGVLNDGRFVRQTDVEREGWVKQHRENTDSPEDISGTRV
jgi:hypothetical protein